MDWEHFTPWSALIGGALIGLSTGLVLLLNGKIAGISGVVGRVLRPAPNDTAWRVWFVVGMIVGGAATFALHPPAAALDFSAAGPALMAGAGLLVGFGARLSGGCTSGHGVCGISRGSKRGLVGTLTFMAVAGLVVYVRRHVLGGGA